jgi:hypothetical protein
MSFLGMLRVYRQDVVDGYVGGMQWYPHPHIHYLHALPHVSWRGVGTTRDPSRE